MMRSDITLCSWNNPAPLAGNTLEICGSQTVWLTTEFGDWWRNVCTLYNHLSTTPVTVTSDLKQRLIDTWTKSHRITNVIDKAVGQWRKRHFHCSRLKTKKVSKSEWIKKLNMHIISGKYADIVYRKLSKLVRACRDSSLPKLVHFFETV